MSLTVCSPFIITPLITKRKANPHRGYCLIVMIHQAYDSFGESIRRSNPEGNLSISDNLSGVRTVLTIIHGGYIICTS
jgi:hypothetical protein